ncbi:MAG: insulinase family protein [Bacteroidetes bacterium]|nr:insulinase family protein [Bacteroidota bacterium]
MMSELNRTQAPATRAIKEWQISHTEPQTLGHGNRLYYFPKPGLGVVKLDFFWPVGSAHQSHSYQARTALTLSLSGSTEHTAEQIQEKFEYLGASTSSETQLFGSSLSLKCSSAAFIPALEWLVQHYQDAVFPEQELANYKQMEIAGLQRKMHTPRYWSNRKCLEHMYHYGSPMAKFASVEDIAAVDAADLLRYHQHHLSLSNAVVFVCGEVSNRDMQLLETLFSDRIAFREAPVLPAFAEEPVKSADLHVKHRVEHTSQVSLMMGRRIPAVSPREMHKLSLVNMLMGGFFGSRLMQEIREERGLTYGIGSYVSQSTDGNNWFISGEMNSAKAEETVEAVAELMNSMRHNPPQGEELEKAKRYYAGQFRTGFDGPFAMPRKIQNLMMRGFDYSYFDCALETLWNTDSREISQWADNYLHPETFTVVLAGDTQPTFDQENS